MSTFVRENKHLYCLRNKRGFWLSTLATNRSDSWGLALKYSNTGTLKRRKDDLKRAGYSCVPVLITEIK